MHEECTLTQHVHVHAQFLSLHMILTKVESICTGENAMILNTLVFSHPRKPSLGYEGCD